MIRAILIYLVLSIAFGFAISVYRQATGQQRWAFAKTAGYAIICSVLSLVTLFIFVQLF